MEEIRNQKLGQYLNMHPLFALGIKKFNFFRYMELLLIILLFFGLIQIEQGYIDDKIVQLKNHYYEL